MCARVSENRRSRREEALISAGMPVLRKDQSLLTSALTIKQVFVLKTTPKNLTIHGQPKSATGVCSVMTRRRFVLLSVFALLLSITGHAGGVSPKNPYQSIVERNVFGLQKKQ